MSNYSKLKVWKKAMNLTVEIYCLTKLLPESERFGLIDQMRRAAVSIPSNIAEGYSRCSDKEFIHFLRISRGSVSELETQIMLCERISYLDSTQLELAQSFCIEIDKMLNSLIRKIKKVQKG